MKQMTPVEVERAMKLQDVMLRAMAKRITWYQAAETLEITGQQMLSARPGLSTKDKSQDQFGLRRGQHLPRIFDCVVGF